MIESSELRFETALCQEGNGSFVGGKNLRAGSALHGFYENGVAVEVVEDEHVCVAGIRKRPLGRCRLTTGWLAIDV